MIFYNIILFYITLWKLGKKSYCTSTSYVRRKYASDSKEQIKRKDKICISDIHIFTKQHLLHNNCMCMCDFQYPAMHCSVQMRLLQFMDTYMNMFFDFCIFRDLHIQGLTIQCNFFHCTFSWHQMHHQHSCETGAKYALQSIQCLAKYKTMKTRIIPCPIDVWYKS